MANWNGQVLSEIIKQLDDFQKQGFPPTLRGMYYTLVDLQVIPKTESAYGALSDHTSRWRENGILSKDCFADHTRVIIKDFDDDYETIEDYLQRGIRHLEYAADNYSIPRWYKQPYYVEVWLEKDAAVETFSSIVKVRDVIVVPNRGHSSVAFFNSNVDSLKQIQREGKITHILYFGDLDPSGEAMDKVYKRKLIEYGLYNANFERLAVTENQMKRFQLLHNPDPETLTKLRKDTNRFEFMEKYGLESELELFAIHLEAMQTPNVRGYLKRLVLSNIDRHFEKDIYQQELAKIPDSTTINGLVRTEMLDLLERLGGGR